MAEAQEEVARVRGASGRELIVHRFRPPDGTRCWGRAMVLHGIQSHAGWYRSTCRFLAAAGMDVAAPERRGSGRDRRDRGDAASAGVLLEDARRVADWLAAASGSRPVWVGVSWGAKLAYVAAASHPQELSGLALVVPGLLPRIQMSRPERFRVVLGLLRGGWPRLPIPLEDPGLFTDSPELQEWVATDPLSLRSATARFFMATHALDARVRRHRRRLVPGLPVLLVLAAGDRIVDNPATVALLRWKAAEQLEVLHCPRARHTPELSADAAAYQRRLLAFCRRSVGRGDALVAENQLP